MTKTVMPKIYIYGLKLILLLSIIFPEISCDRKYYNGSLAVEQHLWQLQKIDTFYGARGYRPAATWYNAHDRLNYVDNDHEFPYPFEVGAYVYNFDRK